MRIVSVFLLVIFQAFSPVAQNLKIYVHLDTSIKQSLTGRLYIFSQPDTTKGVQDPDPFDPSPTFHKDVENWQGEQVQVFEGKEAAYPVSLNEVKPGWYKFAAVMDVNTGERSNTAVPGNYYSRKDVVAEIKAGAPNEVHIRISNVFRERPFRETETIKYLSVKSEILTRFHHKDIYVKAAVILPASYKSDTIKKYPLVFIIPGWGGTHYDALQKFATDRYGVGMGKEKIYVYLNPETQTRFGLHAFVDSRVNGPWGKALVEEVKPWLAVHYRLDTDPSQHFITGQSSGGYGALWLQLNYPAAFGGCWSVSPDPVDFSDFTGINLYEKDVNMFYDKEGKERPFFIINGNPHSTMKKFMDFEAFMGDGGQQQSFEAEFGIMGKDGKPEELFDKRSGAIHPGVVANWKKYDLGLFIQNRWKKIRKDAAGKIFVFAGAEDNFFLHQAVKAFRKKAEKANAALVAELVPGANHWTVWQKDFVARMHGEFDKRIKNSR
ncbi:MAG: hypothetical protein JNN00_17735 [Chitinophagaceae bacterium]|nr:hypothetical protein [Chitinophagaceae bacterium]